MKTVTLEVFAVDMAKAVGFRRIEPTGPAGVRFGLYLPSDVETLTTYLQLVDIVKNHIADSFRFPWGIGYIHINPGSYAKVSNLLLAQWVQEFPLAEDCRISSPAELFCGLPLR